MVCKCEYGYYLSDINANERHVNFKWLIVNTSETLVYLQIKENTDFVLWLSTEDSTYMFSS